MKDEQKTYLIAVARGSRDRVPKNWINAISASQDVEVVNSTDYSAKIKATPQAVELIRQSFSDDLLIEPIIERKPMAD